MVRKKSTGRKGIMANWEEVMLLTVWSRASPPTWDVLSDHLDRTYPGTLPLTKEEQSTRHLFRLTPRQARVLVREEARVQAHKDFGSSRYEERMRVDLLRRLSKFVRESETATVGGKYRISLLRKKRKRGKK